MNTKQNIKIPADGWKGFRENFKTDAISGFIVFLLALPLSLGIAKASDFPPVMGLLTAIVGGILVSFIMGSRLTIKGPAAGLIVIVAGAVAEFGHGDSILGWKLALGAMVVAGIVQVLFGIFKLGKLADFFPLSAIHGMLAAIGIIIIVKQIPVLLNDDPLLAKGMGPIKLLLNIPKFVMNLDPKAAMIGVISLLIMIRWPYIKSKNIKMIPAPLVVLLFAIPAELFMHFKETEPEYALVKIGGFIENLNINVSFSGLSQTGTFIKYVIMFALVGTLESLLTVKAIDMLDPFKRKSDMNKDLIAVGLGNAFVAIFGGIPMISEVARSSSNVSNGAKTRWANFFHGFFILLFLVLAAPILEMIPNAALAAMLITVGIKLAHPKEFVHTFKIGKEQLAIFLVTIFFTLVEDLLIGIAAGMVLKIIIHIFNGTPVSSFFKAPTAVSFQGNNYLVEINKAAIFTNYLGIKRKLEEIPYGFNVTIDLKNTKLVDHSVMENLEHFKHDYENNNGEVQIIGLEKHIPLSKHPLASRKNKEVIVP
ncbi:SulP family inorganic anion transporter [Aquimarina muelleri]|uniref:Sulfate transporter n=1 Tax=Aquimarina muelleri TaxID=279356 RepID=A0A918JV63_9FLAO|nr:SulP family inorganic anion transporter [Aquimarina muelleri]MCX2761433.1 SulP family inorganic anion transporter [Aquimarina muelleri]GGX13662.1 sulfate transporter [Aquimarina muelleri]